MLAIGTYCIIAKTEPIWTFSKQVFAHHNKTTITIISELLILLISLFSTGCLKLIQYLGSQKREELLIKNMKEK